MADPVASRILDFASRDPGRVALHVLRSDSKGVFRDDALTFGAWVEGALACAAAPRTAEHLRKAGLLGADLPVVEPAAPGVAHAPQPEPAVGDETALIQYTSGSTGTPRGVVITADNLAANADAMGKALNLNADD